MKLQEAQRDLYTMYRAKYGVVSVSTTDERRAEVAIRAVAARVNAQVITWTITRGPVDANGQPLFADEKTQGAMKKPDTFLAFSQEIQGRTIIVAKDFAPFLESPITRRALRDTSMVFNQRPPDEAKTLVLLGPNLTIPADCPEITPLDFPLPDRDEMCQLIEEASRSLPEGAPTPDMEALSNAAAGLSAAEAGNVFARSIVSKGSLDPGTITTEKKIQIAKGGLLEWVESDLSLDDIGGLELFKEWALRRRCAFSDAAKAFGIETPNGVLATGVSGCGKSLLAKVLVRVYGMAGLRLDPGRLMGGMVGDTESRTREVFKQIEAAAPCLLWVDEADKAFSGVGSGGDSGVASRMFGSFLTWMQETKADVFVMMTANDVSALPPEFLRKGRFDEVFFIDLPNATEREAIFKIHCEKRGHVLKAESYRIMASAQFSQGFSGAEIEAAVKEALVQAFNYGADGLTESHVVDALTDTVPLSKTAGDKIKALQEWAKTSARPASRKEEKTADNAASRWATA